MTAFSFGQKELLKWAMTCEVWKDKRELCPGLALGLTSWKWVQYRTSPPLPVAKALLLISWPVSSHTQPQEPQSLPHAPGNFRMRPLLFSHYHVLFRQNPVQTLLPGPVWLDQIPFLLDLHSIPLLSSIPYPGSIDMIQGVIYLLSLVTYYFHYKQ